MRICGILLVGSFSGTTFYFIGLFFRDCLRVPSLTNAADGKALAFSRFCGRMGLNTKDNQDGDATIKLCSNFKDLIY